jgi:lysophospholipid acyltransferase (LPLAT)-like uncharacterized protein
MSFLQSVLPHVITPALRILASTWRFRIADVAGLGKGSNAPLPPVIWMLWHNRLLVVPILYERFFRHRKAAALVSRSGDGGLLANCLRHFGGETVRGSSSRGGSAALQALRRKLAEGYDLYITPDGPRGPRYNMSPGAVWMAQDTGAQIVPMKVEYSSFWRLGRWDGFVIPKPFAKITVSLKSLVTVQPTQTESELQEQCERLRGVMMEDMELH